MVNVDLSPKHPMFVYHQAIKSMVHVPANVVEIQQIQSIYSVFPPKIRKTSKIQKHLFINQINLVPQKSSQAIE